MTTITSRRRAWHRLVCTVDAEAPVSPSTLAQQHGTPERFALSVYAAVPSFISVDEARDAIDKYQRLWASMPVEAGYRVVRASDNAECVCGGEYGYYAELDANGGETGLEVFCTCEKGRRMQGLPVEAKRE